MQLLKPLPARSAPLLETWLQKKHSLVIGRFFCFSWSFSLNLCRETATITLRQSARAHFINISCAGPTVCRCRASINSVLHKQKQRPHHKICLKNMCKARTIKNNRDHCVHTSFGLHCQMTSYRLQKCFQMFLSSEASVTSAFSISNVSSRHISVSLSH